MSDLPTPSESAPDPYIFALPTELVAWIAEYLESCPIGLLNLRQTCKELCTKTQDVVARRYFTDRAFFISDKWSLHTLYFISEHPVFVKSMKQIEFSLATFQDSYTDHERRQRANGWTGSKNRGQRTRQREYRKQYDQLIEDENRLRRKESDLQYLRVILSNFQDAGNIPALVATGEKLKTPLSLHMRAWGYKRYCRKLGYDNCLEMWPEDERPFAILFQAIIEIGYPVTHLELGCEARGVPPMAFALWEDGEPFAKLKTLRLSIGPDRRTRHYCGDELDDRWDFIQQCFTDFLYQARDLETLVLIGNTRQGLSPFDGRVFEAVWEASQEPSAGGNTAFQHLQRLELVGHTVELDMLFQLAKALKETLIELTMRRVDNREHSTTALEVERQIRQEHGGDLKLNIDGCFEKYRWYTDFDLED